MMKEILEIQKRLESLIDGNWTNSDMGKLEELEQEIKQIGNLLIFIIAILIQRRMLDIDFIKGEFLEGWKIDYK